MKNTDYNQSDHVGGFRSLRTIKKASNERSVRMPIVPRTKSSIRDRDVMLVKEMNSKDSSSMAQLEKQAKWAKAVAKYNL